MQRIGLTSRGIARIPYLAQMLQAELSLLTAASHRPVDAVAGWGMRPTAGRAQAYAQRHGLPYWGLEDGFLRSFGTGDAFPPLSVVLDKTGIYYDCTRPSDLERLLASEADVLAGAGADAAHLMARLVALGLSKYNHAPAVSEAALRAGDVQRILVVDQTAGDMSVSLGAATAASFAAMLQAALDDNPAATVYVKTHPEVSAGRKAGYLSHVQDSERVLMLRQAVQPMSLLSQMDKVYVVTSTMGFEALLAGKPVTCFGLPWYAGWGATDDRLSSHPAMQRRSRQRSVLELFAAAYVHYSHYLNPETKQRGSLMDVLDWLERQCQLATPGRTVVVGFRRWKAANTRQMLGLRPGSVHFVRHARAAAALHLQPQDCLVVWGRVAPVGVPELAQATGARLLRMEDGFVRSVGLGSDLIAPKSFVLDGRGIYFDPSHSSDLEVLLNEHLFSAQDRERAQWVRQFIVRHGITKYNLEPLQPVAWADAKRQVVLVPGQVEDDASIRFGCDCVQGVHTNLGLLQAARAQFPQALLVYKPHPDVQSGNRHGRLTEAAVRQLADQIETSASVVSCLAAADVVVTMTSLTGFDALLRGKQVVVHGRPFYAGWGLTEDVLPVPRRQRALSLDELVAAALLHYPRYWDAELRGYTTCEAVLQTLLDERQRLEQSGGLERLRSGWWRRQGRKVQVLLRGLRT